MAQKQKEIILTLRRDKAQQPEEYPHDFLDLFEGIYHFAEKTPLRPTATERP